MAMKVSKLLQLPALAQIIAQYPLPLTRSVIRGVIVVQLPRHEACVTSYLTRSFQARRQSLATRREVLPALPNKAAHVFRREFHRSTIIQAVQPYLLGDIGEGKMGKSVQLLGELLKTMHCRHNRVPNHTLVCEAGRSG